MLQKTIGVICLVGGTLLVSWAYHHAQSLEGEVHRIFTPSNQNRLTWAYVAGAVLCTVGLFQIYTPKK